MWVSVCCEWPSESEKFLASVSLDASVWKVFLYLSILARRLHKELCSRESARPEVRGGNDQGRWSVESKTRDRKEQQQ